MRIVPSVQFSKLVAKQTSQPELFNLLSGSIAAVLFLPTGKLSPAKSTFWVLFTQLFLFHTIERVRLQAF